MIYSFIPTNRCSVGKNSRLSLPLKLYLCPKTVSSHFQKYLPQKKKSIEIQNPSTLWLWLSSQWKKILTAIGLGKKKKALVEHKHTHTETHTYTYYTLDEQDFT